MAYVWMSHFTLTLQYNNNNTNKITTDFQLRNIEGKIPVTLICHKFFVMPYIYSCARSSHIHFRAFECFAKKALTLVKCPRCQWLYCWSNTRPSSQHYMINPARCTQADQATLRVHTYVRTYTHAYTNTRTCTQAYLPTYINFILLRNFK